MTPLTLERIFSAPSLSGKDLKELRFSPDGNRLTFLQGKEENPEQQDLWEYDIKNKEFKLLVDSTLLSSEEELSDEEKARRERKRNWSQGIIEYYWSQDGDALLFPLNGKIYSFDLTSPPDSATRCLTQKAGFSTDIRFSPLGRFVSFIRDQNLFLIDREKGKEKQLTHDNKEHIKNGMAEFVAQEEMDRYTGYWWSPDESYIAFVRVDESPVPISQRYEIRGDSFDVFQQRYPYPGSDNVTVELLVLDLASGKTQSVDLGENRDIYLARVNWLPNSKQLAIQIQNRKQQILELFLAEVSTGQVKLLLREKSNTWVPLHNDLLFFQKQPRFIWSSLRNGFKHLYLYNTDGTLIRPLTQGEWMVNSLLSVDEEKGTVYFDGWTQTPTERHLYWASLETETPEKVSLLTQGDGWHKCLTAKNHLYYLDRFSHAQTPPQVSLHRINGERIAFLEQNTLNENHPFFPYLPQISVPEYGQIQADDGQALYYCLNKPISFDPNKKYPVIVWVYGGPTVQKVTEEWQNPWVQFMAEQGYVIFQLDNRGSGSRGKAFEGQIYGQLGEVEVQDQITGARFLQSLPFIDGGRVGVFGHSYGGYMALMLMLKAPELFQAGVSVAPVTDWMLYDTHYTERYLGLPQENQDGYVLSSVFPFVENLEGALLIMHGMADDNVLFTNSTKLFKALQDKDIPFEMMNYPGSKHGLQEKSVRIHRFKAITRFFEKNLKNIS